jgi:hypothetical protein
MFESLTLSVDELARRWNITQRQVLDNAQQMRVPLYFTFEGLAIDSNDEWHRFNGDFEQRTKLEILKAGIANSEAWIARSALGRNGQWEQRLSSEEARELRSKIEADKRMCAELRDLLELREAERNKLFYRGLMRAPPKVLWDIQTQGKTATPRWAFHPQSPVKSVALAGRRSDGAIPIWDGRLMELEPSPGSAVSPPLTIGSLCAVTAEVKAIEAHLQPRQEGSRTGTQRKLTDAQEVEIAALFDRGHGTSVRQLASDFGVSRPTIDVVLKRAGLKK